MTDAWKTILRSMFTASAVLGLCIVLPFAADAQGVASGLVNISTPNIVAPQQLGFRADARVFGGDENTTYGGADIRYGLASNWELGVGASLAQFENFSLPGGGIVRHGGTDLEISAKYAVKQSYKSATSAQVGVGLPNTPAQTSAHLTLGLAGSLNVGSGVDLYLNPRAALITDNSIIGLGIGAKIKLARQTFLIGDYTPILTGANTIDVNTGTQRSRDIYGAAIRFALGGGAASIDVGWTNGTGFTTGSSLTPGLGNSSAFYVTLNLKR